MYLFAVGAGVVMRNGMAGAIAPFAHMAGLASAVLGFAQMTGAAAYSVGVSHFLDGTARPMTFAIAASGLACFASALLLRRR
jgi:DHA1 family bicyclomycin/chloramphenicol resistance-like MFS transporter